MSDSEDQKSLSKKKLSKGLKLKVNPTVIFDSEEEKN
jgi:hypothetical protein